MRKVMSMLLVLVMLFSLCACGSNDSQTANPSDSAPVTTEGTTEPTQAPTNEPTTAPTEEPTTVPADEPTTPPTQAPTEATKPSTEAPTVPSATKPATCSHSWKNATCTAPKTCSKCNATEGSAAGHSWKAATCTAPKTCSKCNATEGSAKGHSYSNGTCSGCGTADPSYKKLTDGAWMYKTEAGYFKILTFGANGVSEEWNERIGEVDKYLCTIDEFAAVVEEYKEFLGEFWTDPFGWCLVCELNGVQYVTGHVYELSSRYTAEGNSIVVESAGETYTLVRTDSDTLKITASTNQFSIGEEYHWVASGYVEGPDVGSYFQ